MPTPLLLRACSCSRARWRIGSVAGLSLASGPVLGGLLVSGIGWRSIFWITVPVGLIAIVLTQRFIPESRAEQPRRLDPYGQLLVITLLGCLTAGIIEGPRSGWGSAPILALFAVAVLAAIALVLVESRRREPLVDMRYFRSAPFSGAALIGVFALATLGGFLFLNTLYLQDVRVYSALHAGLLTIPMAAMLGVLSLVSGRLVARRGPRLALILSGALIAVGAGLLVGLSAHTAVWYLIVAYLVFGTGAGLVSAPITNMPSRACPETRPVSPARSPRPVARPVRPSGSRSPARSSPPAQLGSCTPATRRGRCSLAVESW
jgi:MFS family permease